MTHYEERLERDLERIREKLRRLAEKIGQALRNATHAVLTHDHALASDTILDDLEINRQIRALDERCHAFIALYLPSAGHLRYISSVLRLNIALERVGDYAVAIAREAAQLSDKPPGTVAGDIELMAEQSGRLFQESMIAFNAASPERARGTQGMAYQVSVTFAKVFADLLKAGEKGKRPLRDLFALLVVFNRLSRVADQAKNVCEETIFAVTGETKAPRVYRILFLDERNAGASQLAEALARKAFPTTGSYESAGWAPADTLDPGFKEFMDNRGFDVGSLRPSGLPPTHEQLATYQIIISLQGDARPHLEELPFHTVLLEWDVGAADRSADETALEEMRKALAARMQELMERLRGEGAS